MTVTINYHSSCTNRQKPTWTQTAKKRTYINFICNTDAFFERDSFLGPVWILFQSQNGKDCEEELTYMMFQSQNGEDCEEDITYMMFESQNGEDSEGDLTYMMFESLNGEDCKEEDCKEDLTFVNLKMANVVREVLLT